MRATIDSLPQLLKQKPTTCYFLFGTDEFLLDQSVRRIRAHVCDSDEVERIEVSLNAQIPDSFEALYKQGGLFTVKRLIEVQISKLTAGITKWLQQIAQHQDRDTVFLIQAPGLKINQSAEWFTSFIRQQTVVPHYPLTKIQFSQWVQQQAQQRGITLSGVMLERLMQTTEGNCLAAQGQLDQFELTSEDDLNFEQQSEYTLFSIIEAALSNQAQRVVDICERLRHNGAIEPQLLLWALVQTVRVLLQLAYSPQLGQGALYQAKIPNPLHPLYLKVAQQKNMMHWQNLLVQLASADKLLKTGETNKAWLAILDINLNLSSSLNSFRFFLKQNR